jgi:hypothetical protein
MNKKIKKLKEQYEAACKDYVKIFCDKQEIDFNGWVSGEIGGIAMFCDQYFFNISDIVLDVNTMQKKHLILEWQNDYLDSNFSNQQINYKSYTMGLRYEQLKKQ